MLSAYYEHFISNFWLLVAFHDMGLSETMAALNGAIPRANSRFFRRDS